MRSIKAKITPGVLTWARESAGFSPEQVARKFGKEFKPERIAAWEAGDDRPTIVQLRKLSQIYNRPLAVFYLPTAPRDFPVPHDFRRLPETGKRTYSPGLRYELRAAQERRRFAITLFEELEEQPPTFKHRASLDDGYESVAARARKLLGITLDAQAGWKGDQYKALRSWKEAVEALGVLVFQVSEISSSEMRGFSISEDVLPIMAVNRSETPRARIFSMMHEVTHLLLRKSAVCDFDEQAPRTPDDQRIEVFCNRVAAEVLVPKHDFLAQPIISSHPARPREWDEADISELARRYSVSREVIVRSLLTHGRTTEAFYRSKREEYRRAYQEWKDSREGGYENYGEKRLRILGNTFSRLVLDTYYNGRLTLTDVTGHLGIKIKYLADIENALGVR